MEPAMSGKAAGVFALTTIDDRVVLVVSGPVAAVRVVVGQYLGFGAMLVVSLRGAWASSMVDASRSRWSSASPGRAGTRAGR